MNIQFPEHVVRHLQANKFNGSPEEWPFQVKALSKERAFLLFGGKIGFIVIGNDWVLSSMAKAAATPEDQKVMNARFLDLENISGIAVKAWLFSDGSIQWYEKGQLKTVEAFDGTTFKTLTNWCDALQKKEASFMAKLLGQRQMYLTMRLSLITWRQHLVKLMATPVNAAPASTF